MGDLALRISLLVQRGFICLSCGNEIDGAMSEQPRKCDACSSNAGGGSAAYGNSVR